MILALERPHFMTSNGPAAALGGVLLPERIGPYTLWVMASTNKAVPRRRIRMPTPRLDRPI
jgi:hypothetical protein